MVETHCFHGRPPYWSRYGHWTSRWLRRGWPWQLSMGGRSGLAIVQGGRPTQSDPIVYHFTKFAVELSRFQEAVTTQELLSKLIFRVYNNQFSVCLLSLFFVMNPSVTARVKISQNADKLAKAYTWYTCRGISGKNQAELPLVHVWVNSQNWLGPLQLLATKVQLK